MSCFDTPDEQLYLFEVTLNDLTLSEEKLYECDNRPLYVKLKFLDLPIVILSPNDFFDTVTVQPVNEKKNGIVSMATGRSCLFGRHPKILVREMQKTPVRIGIFCDDETYPIAQVAIQLTGCMCDQVAMAMNDSDHLPKPFVLGGKYGLIDPGENPSGSIDLQLKITCLGRYVTTHYQMRENAFVFKNDRDEGQYFVKRINPGDLETLKYQKNSTENVEIPVINSKSDEIQNGDEIKEKKKLKKTKKK
uniref:Uncharacterized protein n=1 Tax=Bracon brevicornis TaxID=1563983 RepID=A0A6V7ILS2_9HYME